MVISLKLFYYRKYSTYVCIIYIIYGAFVSPYKCMCAAHHIVCFPIYVLFLFSVQLEHITEQQKAVTEGVDKSPKVQYGA